MSVAGFTPPRACVNTPSTETSSGSFLTKEPDAQRQKVEHSASCSVSGPQSTAGLVLDLRRSDSEQENTAAGAEGSVVPGSLGTGATPNSDDLLKEDDSDLEAVGSSSSGLSYDWHPQPREATLEGQTFEELAAQLNTNPLENKEPREEEEEKKLKNEQALDGLNSPPAGGSDPLYSGRTSKIEPWSGLPRGPKDLLQNKQSDETPTVGDAVKSEFSPAFPEPKSESSLAFPEQSPECSSDVFGLRDIFKSTRSPRLSAPRTEEQEDCSSPPNLTPLGPAGQGGRSQEGVHSPSPPQGMGCSWVGWCWVSLGM